MTICGGRLRQFCILTIREYIPTTGSYFVITEYKFNICIRAQIICDSAHLSAHGYMDPALAAEVITWYQDTWEEFVVVRAYNECVHNMEVERKPRRI